MPRPHVVHRVQVLAEGLPAPVKTLAQRLVGHALDVDQIADQHLVHVRPGRRQTHAAVAGDDGGHAVLGRGCQQAVPAELGVVMRVRVDEAGAHGEAVGLDAAPRAAAAARAGDGADAVAVDENVAGEGRRAAAVDDAAAFDDQVVHGRFSWWPDACPDVVVKAPDRRGVYCKGRLNTPRTLSRRIFRRSCGRQVHGVLGQDFLRPRPGGVRVRVVVGPQQVVHVQQVLDLEGAPVVLEGDPDVVADVLAGHLREALDVAAGVVEAHRVVDAVRVVRQPAGVALGADHAQLRVALEHAAEHEQADHVLHRAHDLQERRQRVAAAVVERGGDLPAAGGQDVKADRQVQIHRALPQGVVFGLVVIALLRVAGHHHADEAHGLGALEVLDGGIHRRDRRLRQAEQTPRRRAAKGLQPAVVGLKAGVHVGVVRMAAQHHAERGVDHLGVQAVALLGLDARQRIPAAGRQLVEGGPGDEVLLGVVLQAGAGQQPDRGGARQVTHPVGVVTVRVAHHARRRVAVLRAR